MNTTILSPAIAALLILSVATSAPAQSAATSWPPRHMQDLSPEYLARQLSYLQATSANPPDTSIHPVFMVRDAIASLTLKKHLEEFNAYFERDEFVQTLEANPTFGFSLFSCSYVRIYGLFNDRTGVMKGRLSAKAQSSFEKALWGIAKAYSKLTDARRDVWDQHGSENHHLTSKTSDFLVAQYFRDHPDYAKLTYDDGSTPQQQYDARVDYWNRWFDARAKRGLFEEDGSSYQNYVIEALFNVRDLAADPVLRTKADMFLDLVFANFAEETLGTQRGGPKTRTKDDDFRCREYDMLFDSPGSSPSHLSHVPFASTYYPPSAISNLARDISGRGIYSFVKRAPDAVVPESTSGPLWMRMDSTHTMNRVGFATPHYLVGSHGLDTTAPVAVSREQRWQGIVFANDPQARIGMDGVNALNQGGNYITNPFQNIQDRNLMVTRKWGKYTDENVDPNLWIYFSSTLDSVEGDGDWIFVKSGGAFAAVKIVEGGFEWQRPWKHSDSTHPDEKSYIRMKSEHSPILMIANDSADYDNDFSAFKKVLKSQPISWVEGVLKFATITHEGLSSPGKVSGKSVEISPARVNDSPFIRSDWDSGVVYIRGGDDAMILDFSDPKNPKKTVGVKPDERFPAGTGVMKPIIFSELRTSQDILASVKRENDAPPRYSGQPEVGRTSRTPTDPGPSAGREPRG